MKLVAPEAFGVVRNSTLEDGLGPSSTLPSYSVDLPGEGNDTVENNTIVQRAGAPNNSIIDYADSQGSTPGNRSLLIDDNVVRNERSNGTLLRNITDVTPTIQDNVLVGVSQLTTGGGPAPNVSGSTTPTTAHSFSGPLLGVNGADGAGQIAEFDGTGGTVGGLAQPSGIVGNTGIASLGGEVYVANRIQGVGHVDPLTGSSTAYRGPQGIEALGTYGNTLIAGVFDTDSIVQFGIAMTVEPHPVEMTTLMLRLPNREPIGITGLDSNDTTIFYVGSYYSGDIYEFDPMGAYLGSISTGLGADILSGLAYDRGNDTLWLATGYGNNQVYHYDLTGSLLGSFAAPIEGMGGLDVFAQNVPTPPGPPDLPEPSTSAIFILATLALLARWGRPARASSR